MYLVHVHYRFNIKLISTLSYYINHHIRAKAETMYKCRFKLHTIHSGAQIKILLKLMEQFIA
ncbi:hypothetical protein D3C77_650850 [compost metagenome]